MPNHRIEAWLEESDFSTASRGIFPVSGPSGGIGALFGWTAGTPVATANRWAPAALNLDYTNRIPYYNSGTYAVPVWTSLLGAGAVSVAFRTIDCPAGTDPVADTTTDTLVLTSSGGTMTITGNSGTDTINFEVAALGVANAQISATAAIAYTKLAALTRGSIISGQTAGNVPTALDAKTDKYILIGDGTDVNSVLWSGDVALANTGASTVTDLTITSEAQGTILYFNGSNWVVLPVGTAGQGLVTAGAGSNPYWGSPTVGGTNYIVNNTTFEGGTYDPVLSITTQTTGAATLTLPDFANVNDTFTFNTLAANLLNKGLDDASTYWGDTADMTKKVSWELSGATTAKTLTLDSNHTDDRVVLFPDASTNLVGHDTTDTLSNKTLTAPIFVSGGFLADANGNEQLVLTTTATAVNYWQMTNSATANPATQTLAAAGTDTNIHALITAKGTGKVQCQHGGGAAVEIVNLSDSQALTNKSYNGLTLTSTTGTFTLTAAKVFAVTNTLTLSGTDSTIMTFPGTSQTIAGLSTAQAWTADQTFGNTNFHLLDSAGTWDLIVISTGTGMGADRTLTLDCTNAACTFAFNGNITFASTVQFDAAMSFAGAWTHTGAHTVGITTQNSGTFVFADATAYALTFPTGTDVLVGRASTDTLTNKSLDCNGTGNTLTNINAAELETIADNAIGVPFFIRKSYTNLAAAGTNVITTHPKMRIVLAWNVNTSANGGTVTLHAGQVGALGNAITNTMTPAGDDDQELFDHLIDAEWERTANTGLVVVGDAGGTIDGEICLLCIVIP